MWSKLSKLDQMLVTASRLHNLHLFLFLSHDDDLGGNVEDNSKTKCSAASGVKIGGDQLSSDFGQLGRRCLDSLDTRSHPGYTCNWNASDCHTVLAQSVESAHSHSTNIAEPFFKSLSDVGYSQKKGYSLHQMLCFYWPTNAIGAKSENIFKSFFAL